jgi:hypothetical protein
MDYISCLPKELVILIFSGVPPCNLNNLRFNKTANSIIMTDEFIQEYPINNHDMKTLVTAKGDYLSIKEKLKIMRFGHKLNFKLLSHIAYRFNKNKIPIPAITKVNINLSATLKDIKIMIDRLMPPKITQYSFVFNGSTKSPTNDLQISIKYSYFRKDFNFTIKNGKKLLVSTRLLDDCCLSSIEYQEHKILPCFKTLAINHVPSLRI